MVLECPYLMHFHNLVGAEAKSKETKIGHAAGRSINFHSRREKVRSGVPWCLAISLTASERIEVML
jgi:hypothetical protein